jgi:hypothetical protein
MALENSIARNRAVTAMVATGLRLVEVGELEARVEALEAAADRRSNSDQDDAFTDEKPR